MAAGSADLRTLNALMLGDHAGDLRHLGCDLGGHLLGPVPDGLQLVTDQTANDSDKTFTVGTNEAWRIDSIFVFLTATATNGNRQIMVDITDPSNVVVGRYQATTSIVASTNRNVTFAEGVGGTSTGLGGNQLASLPTDLWLPAAWKVRVYDINAVDPTADDMLVSLLTRQVSQ